MLRVRKSDERGRSFHGWLDSRHTFSFAEYDDPRFRGFRQLRVINDDRVAPGRGFGTHPHRDMEIISYVLEGAIEHKDTTGTGAVLRPGEVQRMTAGTGIAHSEFNPSRTEPLHFLQIWIFPERAGLAPGYQQVAFAGEELQNALRIVASHDGRDGSVLVHQDVSMYATRLAAGASVEHAFQAGRAGWLQVARGDIRVNGVELVAGDGVAIEGESRLELAASSDAEALLFDLA
jgi:redox-sensitive bicupin YhaK (pirin superfamily)